MRAPSSPCPQPGCRNLRPCPTHGQRVDYRPSAAVRGYDRTWRLLRNAHLAGEPLCRHCAKDKRVTLATEVDHIVPIEVRPERRLDPENLQSLCHKCHIKKHLAA